MFGIALCANLFYIFRPEDVIRFRQLTIWISYILLLASGIVVSIYFDHDYSSRRKWYIGFLKNKNATIEYKTKAINAFRAYKNSGNAEEFMEKNIEILEETLEIDRQQIEPRIENKKGK